MEPPSARGGLTAPPCRVHVGDQCVRPDDGAGLQFDTPGPFGAHLLDSAQRFVLRRRRIEVGADGGSAVGVSCAARNRSDARHPASHSARDRWRPRGARPSTCRPGSPCAARSGPCRDGCGCRPGRQNQPLVHVVRRPVIGADPVGPDGIDVPVGDFDIDEATEPLPCCPWRPPARVRSVTVPSKTGVPCALVIPPYGALVPAMERQPGDEQ